jgi:hypothetical protein
VRLKNRRDRRPGLPIEPALIFYSCFLGEFVVKHAYLLREHIRINRIYHRVVNDPDALGYTDQAMCPVREDEEDSLELFTQNKAARAAVDNEKSMKINGVKSMEINGVWFLASYNTNLSD